MSRWSTRQKPMGEEIGISVDSGANIHSENYEVVMPQDLGFDSKADWDAASEEKKLKAVQEYFYCMGHPEWNWYDSENA